MVYQNMINLAIPSVDSVVKVGDRMAELPKVIDDINLRMKQDRYASPTR